MSPFAINLEKTRTDASIVSLEPALNAFGSMVLISKAQGDPGIHEWVAKTRTQMSADELFRHKLVTIGFHYSIIPRNTAVTFERYLETLEATPPSQLRERLLGAYSEICITSESQEDKGKPVNWDDVLSSADNYVNFLKRRFGEELTDEPMEARAYQYVLDPAALKQLVVDHVRWFWKNHLEAEWKRVRPMLEESANAFNQLNLADMTRVELIRFITGKEVDEAKWAGEHEKARELVFIPNAHIGPYIQVSKIQDDFFIYFGAHLPEGSELKIPELDRTEIVSKLSALADETRMQILQLISENGEMRVNEIMESVKLSQPSVSRYLGQLTASGFLQERRVNTAKVYTLNRDRIEKTLKATSAFLLDRARQEA